MDLSLKLGLLTDLDATARAVALGTISTVELVELALETASRFEPKLHAFAWLDPEWTRDLARRVDAARRSTVPLGPLYGVPIAVKDIFDTAGIPTECGTVAMTGRIPANSAAVVQAMQKAGGVMFGKTVTAELAYLTPGPTLNPWNLGRTPGGSSMGSAAAVAAGIIPGAIGSQTNGSVIRPAAFCGVVGFKPSGTILPLDGVLRFSPTLDQVGCFAGTVKGVARLAGALQESEPEPWIDLEPTSHPRIAAVQTDWEQPDEDMKQRFEADLKALATAGAEVSRISLPASLERARPVHRTIMAVEANAALRPLAASAPNVLSDALIGLMDEGLATPESVYSEALERREELIGEFASWSAPYDAIASPPAPGEAPPADTTGDPRFCTRWTLVGAPTVVLPTGHGRRGLPLGLQLTAGPNSDMQLLCTALWVEQTIGHRDISTLLRRLDSQGRQT